MQRNSEASNNIGIEIFRIRGLFAALLIGSAGTLVLGLQPVLLGALLNEGRSTYDEVALIATVEMLAIGIGSALLALVSGSSRMRVKAVALLLLTASADYGTGFAASPMALLIVRGLGGLVEGGLVAIAVELIARSRQPGRNGGWFVVIQTLAQSGLAALLALIIVPRAGSTGGFETLAAVSVATLVATPFLLDDYGPLRQSGESQPIGRASLLGPALALLAIFCLYMFIGAIWAFMEPLGAQSGIDAPTVGLIVSVSLLAQVAGALLATALEPRLRYSLVLGGGAGMAVLIGLGFSTGADLGLFWMLSLATGFLWLFVTPWQISMTLAADDSKKTALLTPAAQLFGAAIGPAGASLFITASNYRPVALFASAAGASSLAFVLLLVLVQALRNRS